MTMLIMHGEFTVQYDSQQHDIPQMIAKHVTRVTDWTLIRAGMVKGQERRCYLTLAVDNVLGDFHEQTLISILYDLLAPFGGAEQKSSDIVITGQQTDNLLDE